MIHDRPTRTRSCVCDYDWRAGTWQIKQLIRCAARRWDGPGTPGQAIEVAHCESNLDPRAYDSSGYAGLFRQATRTGLAAPTIGGSGDRSVFTGRANIIVSIRMAHCAARGTPGRLRLSSNPRAGRGRDAIRLGRGPRRGPGRGRPPHRVSDLVGRRHHAAPGAARSETTRRNGYASSARSIRLGKDPNTTRTCGRSSWSWRIASSSPVAPGASSQSAETVARLSARARPRPPRRTGPSAPGTPQSQSRLRKLRYRRKAVSPITPRANG